MIRGANRPLPDEPIELRVIGAEGMPVSCVALLSSSGNGAEGVASSILVAANSQNEVGGFAALRAGTAQTNFIIDPQALAADIIKIQIILWRSNEVLADHKADTPSMVMLASGKAFGHFDLPEDIHSHTIAVFGECYRRNNKWKVRAVGEGFAKGISPLAQHLNLDAAELTDMLNAAASAPIFIDTQSSTSAAGPIKSTNAKNAEIMPQARTAEKKPAAPKLSDRQPPNSNHRGFFESHGWVLAGNGVQPGPSIARKDFGACELIDVRQDTEGVFWPAVFLYRPDNGEPLPPHTATLPTVGRSLGLDGLPALLDLVGLDAKSGEAMDNVPEGARYFAAGGTPARVLSLDPSDGQINWYAPWSKRWLSMGRCPLPDIHTSFEFGVAGTPDGAFFAAGNVLVHAFPNQEARFECSDMPGMAIAPPGALGSKIVIPLRSPNGEVIIMVRSGDGSHIVAVKGKVAGCETFGEPVTKEESALCFWPGVSGYLAFEDGISGQSVKFHAWPENIEGLPFLRPYRSPNGTFWAMCKEAGDGSAGAGRAVICAMKVNGAKEKQLLLAPCVAVGGVVFRGRERYNNPTGDMLEEINLGHGFEGRTILPIMRIGNAQTVIGLLAIPGDGGSKKFLFREGKGGKVQMALALHHDQGKLEMLNHTIDISSSDDFELFVSGDRLFIHHFESNICKSWRILSAQ
jgi:TerD domain